MVRTDQEQVEAIRHGTEIGQAAGAYQGPTTDLDFLAH